MELLYIDGVKNPFLNMSKLGNRKSTTEVFYERKNNNLLIFDSECANDATVIFGTAPVAYYFMIRYLNKVQNRVIIWSKEMHKASKYTIFKGLPVEELKNCHHNEIIDVLNQYIKVDLTLEGEQYCKVTSNGVKKPLKFK